MRTRQKRAKLVVGLTGGIATGKSTVASMLAERGAVVIDADGIARELVEPGQPALREIEARFGPAVLDARGRLSRQALGRIVFADDAARRDLEAMLHPRIRTEIHRRIERAADGAIVVVEIPLLFESGVWRERVDLVLLVYADRSTQIRRMQARDGLPLEQIQRRLAAQWPTARKLGLSDVVVYNQSDRESLVRQVDDVWELLNRWPTESAS